MHWKYVVDLQLDVKGYQDVYAFFDKYVEVKRLEGDNKYHVEQHGLQVSCYIFMATWQQYVVWCMCMCILYDGGIQN